MRAPVLRVALAVLGALSCAGEPARTTPAVSTRPASPPDSTRVDRYRPDSAQAARDSLLWSFADSLDLTRAELIAKLGEPLRMAVHTARSQYDSTVLDTGLLLVFARLEAEYYVAGGSDAEALTWLSVSDSTLALPSPLRIGMTRAEMEASLGTPWYDRVGPGDTTLASYAIDMEVIDGASSINLHLHGGVVRRIVWMFYVDP